jgi:biopolymer transport protein ExbD
VKKAWRIAVTGFGLAAACAPQRQVTERSVTVSVGGAGTAEAPCFVEVDGERLSMEIFAASTRRWRGREAQLRGDPRTPYRCVGRVVYELQRAGFRIGFLSASTVQ